MSKYLNQGNLLLLIGFDQISLIQIKRAQNSIDIFN